MKTFDELTMIIRCPSLSISSQARNFTSSINIIDQILSPVFHNFFKSEEWLSMFTALNSTQEALITIISNNAVLTMVKPSPSNTTCAQKRFALDGLFHSIVLDIVHSGTKTASPQDEIYGLKIQIVK